jgi:hypothetical protein
VGASSLRSAALRVLIVPVAAAAIIASSACGRSSTSSSASPSRSVDPILASPTPTDEFNGFQWNERGILWTVADPDGQYWERAVPGANLTPAQVDGCASMVVDNLQGQIPGALQLAPGTPRDRALVAATARCAKTTTTTTEREIALGVFEDLGLPVPSPSA